MKMQRGNSKEELFEELSEELFELLLARGYFFAWRGVI
jgi:hypothetical protein